jgi:hypothetical protein
MCTQANKNPCRYFIFVIEFASIKYVCTYVHHSLFIWLYRVTAALEFQNFPTHFLVCVSVERRSKVIHFSLFRTEEYMGGCMQESSYHSSCLACRVDFINYFGHNLRTELCQIKKHKCTYVHNWLKYFRAIRSKNFVRDR